jgi:hypothetical protein
MKNKVIRLSLDELVNVFLKQLATDSLIDLFSVVLKISEELNGKDIERLKVYTFKSGHNKSQTAKKCNSTRKGIEKLIEKVKRLTKQTTDCFQLELFESKEDVIWEKRPRQVLQFAIKLIRAYKGSMDKVGMTELDGEQAIKALWRIKNMFPVSSAINKTSLPVPNVGTQTGARNGSLHPEILTG